MLEGLLQAHCSDPVAWVEENISFPPVISPNAPGRVSLSRQPWAREILEAVLDKTVEHLYLVMGTQTGKTTLCLLASALLHNFDPAPLIWAAPTDKLARQIADRRIIPLYTQTPILAEHLRARDDVSTSGLVTAVMQIYWTGAMTPAKLASTPAAYIICDEEAKFEHVHRHEGHPVLLLEERTKSFARHLVIHASTPNTAGNIFWLGYQQTDMRRWYVPCPHCGTYQSLNFTRATIRWEETTDSEAVEQTIRDTAHYVCPHCGGAITDAERMAMIQRGEWRATARAAVSTKRGYHLSSLYSAFVGIADMACAFWRARGSGLGSLAYQNFVNSWKAEPYTAYALKVDDEHVTALCDTYPRGSLPVREYNYIIVCYDPGEKETHWVATMVGKGGTLYVVDWGTILAFETEEAAGVQGASEHVAHLQWEGARPDLAYIDSGDWTARVYAECERTGGWMLPTKGTNARFGSYNRQPLKTNELLDLVTYSDYQAKTELYGDMIAGGRLGGLHLPQDATPELLHGLSGQTLEVLPSGKKQWKRVRDDHYGDCIKLALVSWWVNRGDVEPVTP